MVRYALQFYEGNYNNIKEVHQEDIAILSALLKNRMQKLKIYIIRHGETDLNKKIMWGQLNKPLNYNGRKLAAFTGHEMCGIHFYYCISSPLIRAKKTVEIVLRESGNHIQAIADEIIKEINFDALEGSSAL